MRLKTARALKKTMGHQCLICYGWRAKRRKRMITLMGKVSKSSEKT